MGSEMCIRDRLYTTPIVSSVTPVPVTVTGLYTASSTLCATAVDGCLFLIINCVTFLSSNVIVSVPSKIDPVFPQPIVENTLILSPLDAVPETSLVSFVFVDTANSPVTVSGARMML